MSPLFSGALTEQNQTHPAGASHVVGHEEVNRTEKIQRGKPFFFAVVFWLFKLNNHDVKVLVYHDMFAYVHVLSSAASRLISVASRLYANVSLVVELTLTVS